MDDDRSQVEQDTRDLSGMRFKFFSSHDTVENQARVGESMSLYCLRPYGPAIWRVGRTKLWIQGVLTAISSC